MNTSDFHSSSPGKVILSQKGYWTYIPDPLPPTIEWSLPLISIISEAERNIAKLTALASSRPGYHVLARPFVYREAVLSSRIEGTRASLVDVLAYEGAQLSFIEPDTDVREVHNYVRAMDYGLARIKTLPVSLRLIREIHAILMEGVRGELLTPGEFRRSQNWIGYPGSTLENAIFVPPPVDEMLICLDSLEKFIHTSSNIPALARLAFIHYQFEAIHPFLDGNGRIGRLLIVLLLCEWGYLSQPLLYISDFIEKHRTEYYDRLLAVSRYGKWEEWLEFFLKAVNTQAVDAVNRLEQIRDLRGEYRQRIGKERSVDRLMDAVDKFFEQPIMNIRQLELLMGIPYKTAQRYITRLEGKGIIREVTGKSRNRLYRADAILQIFITG